MSMKRYLGIISMAAVLGAGCGEPGQPESTDVLQQKAGGGGGTYDDGNDIALYAGWARYLFYSMTTPPGLANPSSTNWYVMGTEDGQVAPVTGMTFGPYNVSVSSLGTEKGWLQIDTGWGKNKLTSTTSSLKITVGAPLAGVLNIISVGDEATYGRYKVTIDGGNFCNFAYLNTSHPTVTNEDMIPVGGARWLSDGSRVDDSNVISLSCSHDAIGGCVRWGYAPWDSVVKTFRDPFSGGTFSNTYSLKNHHQACTRLKRADICGNGVSSTYNSTFSHTYIQVWDSLGIHTMTPQTRSTMEAYWNTNGVACINRSQFRRNPTTTLSEQLALCQPPPCEGTTVTGLMGSAKPCQVIDPNTGKCTAN